ncbi:MAG: EAL domain-containing protein [Planctomycetota bacterium]
MDSTTISSNGFTGNAGEVALLNSCHTTAKARILVVDDERINRQMISCIMEDLGHDVVPAASGEEALEVMKANEFDLVLLDFSMPGMDGFDVMDAMQDDVKLMDIPVIMVTASDESELIVRAFSQGASDYVVKPVDAAVAQVRITNQLNLRQAKLELWESQERYALAARGANDGLWDWNITSNELYVSPRWREMLGYSDSAPITVDKGWMDSIHTSDREKFERALRNHLDGYSKHFEMECRMKSSGGRFLWMQWRGMAVRDQDGVAHRFAGSLTDITENKTADPLTGLPNRVQFMDRLQRCIEVARRDLSKSFAVLFLDLDNFKLINDSYGHEVGDQYLKTIAARLIETTRRGESLVARLGGDEFTLTVEDIDSPQPALAVAKRVLRILSAPVRIENQEIYPGISMGISFAEFPDRSAEDVLREADTAMYEAKSSGGKCFKVFDPVMQQQARKRLNTENELRRSIENNEFIVFYQPLIDLKSGLMCGYESLVRWNHPERGVLSPFEFIDVAEETGLIIPIGNFVLEESCRQLMKWRNQSDAFDDIRCSVNLSRVQLHHFECVNWIESAIEKTGIDAASLTLEITESSILDRSGRPAETLERLGDLGLTIALDDFGTGYSSLSCLHELPIDVLKIDRSFVREMLTSSQSEAIVRVILTLADGLKLKVVAEGIEEETQHGFLKSLDCQVGQGYLYGKPMPARELFEFCHKRNSSTAT